MAQDRRHRVESIPKSNGLLVRESLNQLPVAPVGWTLFFLWNFAMQWPGDCIGGLSLCNKPYSTRAWEAQRQFLFDRFASGGDSGLILSHPQLLSKLSKLERLEIRVNHFALQVAREEVQKLALRCLPSLRILDICIDFDPLVAIQSHGTRLPLEKLVLKKLNLDQNASLAMLCEGILPLLPNLKALEIIAGLATSDQIVNSILPAASLHCPELQMLRLVDHQYGPASTGLIGPLVNDTVPKGLKILAASLDAKVAPQFSSIRSVDDLKALLEKLRHFCSADMHQLAPNLCCVESPDGSHEPLLTALIRNEAPLELIKFLLDNGADPNLRSSYWEREPATWIACVQDNKELLQLLLDHGADPSIREGPMGGNAFTTAASQRSLECLSVLFSEEIVTQYQKKCFPDDILTTSLGENVLHCCVSAMQDEFESSARSPIRTASFFIENAKRLGIDVNSQEFISGDTPLHLATNSSELVDLLLQFGADINALNYAGQSPLFCQQNNVAFSRILQSPNLVLTPDLIRCQLTSKGVFLPAHIMPMSGLAGLQTILPLCPKETLLTPVPDLTCSLLHYALLEAFDRDDIDELVNFLFENLPEATDINQRILPVEGYSGPETNHHIGSHALSWQPLHLAVVRGLANIVDLLVSRGADVNSCCSLESAGLENLSPLVMVSFMKDSVPLKVKVRIVETLCSKGATVPAEADGRNHPLVRVLGDLRDDLNPTEPLDPTDGYSKLINLLVSSSAGGLPMRTMDVIANGIANLCSTSSQILSRPSLLQLESLLLEPAAKLISVQKGYAIPAQCTNGIVVSGMTLLLELFTTTYKAAKVDDSTIKALVSIRGDPETQLATVRVLVNALRGFAPQLKAKIPLLRVAATISRDMGRPFIANELERYIVVDPAKPGDTGSLNCITS